MMTSHPQVRGGLLAFAEVTLLANTFDEEETAKLDPRFIGRLQNTRIVRVYGVLVQPGDASFVPANVYVTWLTNLNPVLELAFVPLSSLVPAYDSSRRGVSCAFEIGIDEVPQLLIEYSNAGAENVIVRFYAESVPLG